MKTIRSSWDDEEDIPVDEEGIYSEEARQELLDEDAISLIEAAFMQGWDEAA